MTLQAVVITRENPFFMPEYVRPIFDCPAIQLRHVFIDTRTSPHLSFWQVLYLTSFRGALQLVALHLLSFFPGGLALRGLPGPRRVAEIAAGKGISVTRLDRAKKTAVDELIRQLAPDIIISVGNSHILPPDVLGAARIVALNSHGSLLPRYRGILAGFWAMLDGASKGGVTIHRMSETVDAGPIVVQRSFDITPQETLFSYYIKVAAVGGALWDEALCLFAKGAVPEQAVTVTGRPYGRPSFSDLRRFRALGRRFL